MNPDLLLVRKNTSDLGTWHDVFDEDKGYHLPPESVVKPDCIVDLGAYVGYTATDFAWKFPSATIIALEPNKQNFDRMKNNIWVAGFEPNILAVNAGIGARGGRGYVVGGHFNAMQVVPDDHGDIMIWGIDFFENFPVDYMKMDIEGAEKEILKRQSGWADNIKCIKVELHNYDLGEAWNDLEAIGFEVHRYENHPECLVGER